MHLKLIDYSTYLGSIISSTGSNVNICIGKAWTVTYKLSTIWKFKLSDKIMEFFQAVVVSFLLHGSWTLTKFLRGNSKRMLRIVFNKSWKQYFTKQQQYDNLPSISQTILVKWTRHARHCWRSRDSLITENWPVAIPRLKSPVCPNIYQ